MGRPKPWRVRCKEKQPLVIPNVGADHYIRLFEERNHLKPTEQSFLPGTHVVHCKKQKCDIYIGRPGIWSNPYVLGRDGTRAEVIEKFRAYILEQPKLLAMLPRLRGKTLGCWCKPLPCHGDVLAELADNLPLNPISKP